jgi:hypothetical protein
MKPSGQSDAADTNRPHPATLDPEALARDCDFHTTRRGGPGGQNRNKVETAVVLTHRPTGLKAQAGERRSQLENRKMALSRLRIELALLVRRPIELGGARPGYSPSERWQGRRKGDQILINPGHEDFPALLAEALDVLYASDDDLKACANLMGCSTSQLIKFFKEAPRAWALINARRREAGRHPLV